MVKHTAKQTKAVVSNHDYSNIFPDRPAPIKNIEQLKLKSEFVFVRRLIKRKDYNEARYRLLQIDHPKADEWLAKLNKIDPHYSESTDLADFILHNPILLVIPIIIFFILPYIEVYLMGFVIMLLIWSLHRYVCRK